MSSASAAGVRMADVVSPWQRWSKATGADYFLLRLRHAHSGGPPHAKIMETIKLFGERVIPHCREVAR